MIRKSIKWVWPILVVMVAVLALGTTFWVQQARIDTGAQRYTSLSAQYDKLFNRYSSLFKDCAEASNCISSAPAPSNIPPPETVPGPSGAPGLPGAAGRDATDEQVARAVEDYCDSRRGCAVQGPPGKDGRDGTDGSPGAPGADGASVSGPQGPAGPAGPAGDPGATGPQGDVGVPGQPPVSWTYTDALGVQYTCNRTDPFDPSAPTYSCALTPLGDTNE